MFCQTCADTRKLYLTRLRTLRTLWLTCRGPSCSCVVNTIQYIASLLSCAVRSRFDFCIYRSAVLSLQQLHAALMMSLCM